jgi:hypothetical protein
LEDSRVEVSQEVRIYESFIVEVEEAGSLQGSPEGKDLKPFFNRYINPHLLQNKSESL